MKAGKVAWLLAGLASAPAFAQSSVTLYGLLDTGVEYVSHANATGGSVVRMPGITGELPSRWGLRGSEDLGGGLKAVFVLESAFNLRGGDLGQGGRLFGRQAWVGLEGNWGTLGFGRQYTMIYWALWDADILGPDIHDAKTAYLWNSAHARFSVSAGGGGTTPAAGVGQLGAMVGNRHLF